MNKLLTIIIPGYNVEHFIVDALNCVFMQKSHEFDVIYVDDASTDNTVSIVETHFANYLTEGRLKIINLSTNGGPATARQHGLDEVKTSFVTFMDADDHYISNDVIGYLLSFLKEDNPDMLMFKYVTDHGRWKLKKKCILPKEMLTTKEAMIHKVKSANPIWHYLWNKCYKTSVIRNNNIRFDAGRKSAEDVLFNRAYLKVCHTIKFVDAYYYVYNCVNTASVTKQSHAIDENDLLASWRWETSNYQMLYLDCQQLGCLSECQPCLAKDLADKTVKFLKMNRRGQILESVIKNDPLYSVIQPYLWKSYFDYCFNESKSNVKKVIKKIL